VEAFIMEKTEIVKRLDAIVETYWVPYYGDDEGGSSSRETHMILRALEVLIKEIEADV
jgi:hypothetical protein